MTETTNRSEQLRTIADKGFTQAKVNYDTTNAATKEATAFLKDSYVTAVEGTTNYNLKIIEIARANFNTACDCVHELLGVNSPPKFVEISTARARKHFAEMAQQSKELAELARKVTTDMAEPFTTAMTKAFSVKLA